MSEDGTGNPASVVESRMMASFLAEPLQELPSQPLEISPNIRNRLAMQQSPKAGSPFLLRSPMPSHLFSSLSLGDRPLSAEDHRMSPPRNCFHEGGSQPDLFHKQAEIQNLRYQIAKHKKIIEVLEQPFTLHALEPGRLLDERFDAMSNAMNNTSWATPFYTSTPLTAGLTKPVFHLIMAWIGMWFVANALLNSSPVQGIPSLSKPQLWTSKVRFSPFELRDGTNISQITAPGISVFGLTLDGVPLEDRVVEDAVEYQEGSVWVKEFDRPLAFNGWYLVTGTEEPGRDPVRFELTAVLEGGSEWVVVGSSSWLFAMSLRPLRSERASQHCHRMPEERRARVIFGYSSSSLAIFHDVASPVVSGIGCFATAVCGMLHQEKLGKRLLVLSLMLFSATEFSQAGFAFNMEGVDSRAKILILVDAICTLLVTAAVYFRENLLIRILIMFGVYFLFSSIYLLLIFCEGSMNRIVIGIASFALFTGFGMAASLKRRKDLRDACARIQPDQDMYDAVWENKVLSAEGAKEALARLETICNTRGKMQFCARQLNRARISKVELVQKGAGAASTPMQLLKEITAKLLKLKKLGARENLAYAMERDNMQSGRMFWGGQFLSGSAMGAVNLSMSSRARSLSGKKHSEDDFVDAGLSGAGVAQEVALGAAFWERFKSSDARTFCQDESQIHPEDFIKHNKFDDIEDLYSEQVLGVDSLDYKTIPGSVDPSNPVTSLDQLFLQASGVDPILRKLIMHWADATDGYLVCRLAKKPSFKRGQSVLLRGNSSTYSTGSTWSFSRTCSKESVRSSSPNWRARSPNMKRYDHQRASKGVHSLRPGTPPPRPQCDRGQIDLAHELHSPPQHPSLPRSAYNSFESPCRNLCRAEATLEKVQGSTDGEEDNDGGSGSQVFQFSSRATVRDGKAPQDQPETPNNAEPRKLSESTPESSGRHSPRGKFSKRDSADSGQISAGTLESSGNFVPRLISGRHLEAESDAPKCDAYTGKLRAELLSALNEKTANNGASARTLEWYRRLSGSKEVEHGRERFGHGKTRSGVSNASSRVENGEPKVVYAWLQSKLWYMEKYDTDQMIGSIVWASIKTPKRASEKVFRSCGGDVSYLLDVSRQTIVFKTITDLCDCVTAMLDDRDVRVMRVKNTMSLSYDSQKSAGYRDCKINLRIVTEETMRLGLDTHVCEVQLLLLDFAKLKNDEGHKRYVTFRNERGE